MTAILDVDRRSMRMPDTREDWLTARAPFVGASEAACLFGEHPFKSSGDLAREKLDGIREPENRAMMRGRYLEDAVAQWWSEEHGLKVEPPEHLYVAVPRGDALGVLCATLDRVLVDEPTVALELKTTQHYVDHVERYWYWQCQAQMLCAGLERVEVGVLDATLDLKSYTVLPNLADQAELLKRARGFIMHIRDGEMPPDALLSKGTLKRLYPEPEVNAVEISPELQGTLRALRIARTRYRQMDSDITRLEEILINSLKGGTDAQVDGATVFTWRPVRRNDIDAQRLRAEHPNIAAEYTRTTTYRRLVLK